MQVVYVVRSVEEARDAARALSTDGLTLFRATMASSLLSASNPADLTLGAFSVPTCLAEAVSEPRLDGWVGRMRSALSGLGWSAEVNLVREDRGLQAVSL